MSLADSIQTLLGRDLTAAEVTNLAKFQKTYDVDDADPITIVLALLAANTLLMSSLPDLLQQKALDTIELHQRTLRDQSSIIAKELVVVLSDIKRGVGSSTFDPSGPASWVNRWKNVWTRHSVGFLAGIVSVGAIIGLFLALKWATHIFG